MYELFLDLDADESRSSSRSSTTATAGRASLDPDPEELGDDLQPLLEVLLEHVLAPTYDEGHPLAALVTNLDASPYVGRLALCRVLQGSIEPAQQVAWCRADGTIERAKAIRAVRDRGPRACRSRDCGARGDRRNRGNPEVTIGETLADADDPRPLPVISVDEPSLSVTIGINTSPLAGLDGDKLTASSRENRLRAELVGNVSPGSCRPNGRTPGR